MGKVFLGFIAAVVLGFAAFTWVTLHWAYSEGERAGFLQKFSRKGWICKTWEGELAMVTLPGTMTEKFEFTVHDESVATFLNANMGRRVTLNYEQHRLIPSTCFGETEYFVTAARVTPGQGAPLP